MFTLLIRHADERSARLNAWLRRNDILDQLDHIITGGFKQFKVGRLERLARPETYTKGVENRIRRGW